MAVGEPAGHQRQAVAVVDIVGIDALQPEIQPQSPDREHRPGLVGRRRRQQALKPALLQLLGLQLDLEDPSPERRDRVGGKPGQIALQAPAQAAQRLHHLVAPARDRLLGGPQRVRVERQPACRRPAAEQQQVHVEAVAVLQPQAGRRHAGPLVDRQRERPEFAFARRVRGHIRFVQH